MIPLYINLIKNRNNKDLNTKISMILGDLTRYLQPLDVPINK